MKTGMAALQGMHVSPAKQSYAWLPRKCDYRTGRQTDRHTERQMPDKGIPMCRYTFKEYKNAQYIENISGNQKIP